MRSQRVRHRRARPRRRSVRSRMSSRARSSRRRHEAELVMGSRMLGEARARGNASLQARRKSPPHGAQNACCGRSSRSSIPGIGYTTSVRSRHPIRAQHERFPFRHGNHHPDDARRASDPRVAHPTYYGEEICYVNGVEYARDVLLSTLKARVQDLDLVYDPKFDCRPSSNEATHYRTKLGYPSTHSMALAPIPAGSTSPRHRLR